MEITALPQPARVDVSAALTAVTNALAEELGEKPSGTWATWRTLDPGCYAEGADAPPTQPRATHPPLVRVTAFVGRPPDVVARMLERIAETLADALALEPGNVFVRYDERRPAGSIRAARRRSLAGEPDGHAASVAPRGPPAASRA